MSIDRRSLIAGASAAAALAAAPAARAEDKLLNLDTVYGRTVIKMRPDIAPKHCAQIETLVKRHFYDGVKFHRVIDGFMAQTGDGQNFNGTGGSKYPNLKAEFSNVPFKRGIVGMARKGHSNDSANSQFFIMYGDGAFLNGQYTVVGEVLSGMDTVDKLKKGEPVPNPDRIVRMQVAADAE